MEKSILKTRFCPMLLLLLVAVFTARAQSKVVNGRVTGTDNQPIAGVVVLEKGTVNGTTTDRDGNFSITLMQSPAVLTFKALGMITQEKNVTAGGHVHVTLAEDAMLIDQVVVTGYSAQKKADLTGAVSVVDVPEMMSVPENNPIKALMGRVPGMTVTADGNTAGTATIRIRGIGTLNNNDPLLVIDGVPTKSGMHELNSNDIESIQVLKDASAASIYGSRAANGVIVITTKRGSGGKVKVNFDGFYSLSYYADHLDVLDAKEYGTAMWTAAMNQYNDPNNNTFGYRFVHSRDAAGNPVLHQVLLPKYVDPEHTMLSSDTDWFDAVSRRGQMQSYNLSVSNGTDKGSYFFSLGMLDNDGVIEYTDFNRYSTRLNSDFKLFGGALTLGENLSVNRTSELQPPGGVLDLALKSLPIIPVHTLDGGWGGPIATMNDRENPARLVHDNRHNRYVFWRTFGNVFADLRLFDGLHLRSSFGIDYGNFTKRTLQYSYQSGVLKNENNGVNAEQSHWLQWVWSNTAAYTKTIGKHSFDALVGLEMVKSSSTSFNAYTYGPGAFAIETPEYMWPSASTGKAQVGGGASGYSLLSYFAKANYSYDNRYLASVTVRVDGSSRFGKANRFGTFPAFSLGWRLSEEAFMHNAKEVVSDLKLRFGWGQTGNQEIADNARHTLYVPNYGTGDYTWDRPFGTAYDITGNGGQVLPSGFRKIQTGNDDLKWETTTQTNIGIDFGFFKNSLYGSVEYYVKKTEDILFKPSFLGALGEGADCWDNGASIRNRGFEVLVGYRGATSFGLGYDITANISGFRNKVTHLPEDIENNYGGRSGDNIIGHPLGSFYGYVADGLFRTQDEVDRHVNQEGKALGRIRYRNLNDDEYITPLDQTWIGCPYPDFSYGLNVNLSYKGFDLTLFLQGNQGGELYNELKMQTDFWSLVDINSNKGRRVLKAWSPTNPGSTIPALQTTNVNNEGRFSTYFIENASYMKLRNLQIGYTLPSKWVDKLGLSKLRVYVSGQNLWTVHSKEFTGVDPENPGLGYPIPVCFTFGLSVHL